jgi:hypothetical protein
MYGTVPLPTGCEITFRVEYVGKLSEMEVVDNW